MLFGLVYDVLPSAIFTLYSFHLFTTKLKYQLFVLQTINIEGVVL